MQTATDSPPCQTSSSASPAILASECDDEAARETVARIGERGGDMVRPWQRRARDRLHPARSVRLVKDCFEAHPVIIEADWDQEEVDRTQAFVFDLEDLLAQQGVLGSAQDDRK